MEKAEVIIAGAGLAGLTAGLELQAAGYRGKLFIENGKLKGVVANGERMSSDHVVLATPLGATQRIIRQSTIDERLFQKLLALPTMPEINLQLELSESAWPVDRVVSLPDGISSGRLLFLVPGK
ncbi:hypothetical protein EDD80_10896 [Anseongella ginsenosidimutans]|uniref:Amine oxidase domain-containing protein n=1 Tax=Anseongella ginsenosidimutans TaxID=496056 RepID=A0A4V2UTJ5_9SPHI|nr:FAD-dependent oxidoreductase [Anseongella ginsenosidimutans]QEC53918.1 NAD(P)/FAD-dependent oxidoreductase [Anseongella ginsenosidimutans]TCS86304.1 hypothetical protein EDD80_10896 [Anseongella ginsenosidimutans]